MSKKKQEKEMPDALNIFLECNTGEVGTPATGWIKEGKGKSFTLTGDFYAGDTFKVKIEIVEILPCQISAN